MFELIRALRLNLRKQFLIKKQHSLDEKIQGLSREKALVKKEHDALVDRLIQENIDVANTRL